MRLRFRILLIRIQARLYRFRYVFLRFTWRRFVFPLYHLYLAWIEKNLEAGKIKPGDFVLLPKNPVDYTWDDRHFGNERHSR